MHIMTAEPDCGDVPFVPLYQRCRIGNLGNSFMTTKALIILELQKISLAGSLYSKDLLYSSVT